MSKIQIYIPDDLEQRICNIAADKGISLSSEIMSTLEKSYPSIEDEENISFEELLNIVKTEVISFLQTDQPNKKGSEYTLYDMSKTFKSVDIAKNDRLTALKPRIGKAFRSLVDNNKIPELEPVISHGRQKRRYNAALYKFKQFEDN